jgi:hypothetical protein
MTTHSCSYIIKEIIDIPSNVIWKEGLMHHAITNRLLRQGLALPAEAPQSLCVHMDMQYIG